MSSRKLDRAAYDIAEKFFFKVLEATGYWVTWQGATFSISGTIGNCINDGLALLQMTIPTLLRVDVNMPVIGVCGWMFRVLHIHDFF